MASGKSPELVRGLEMAFRLCSEAIDMLDACGAPAQIAQHIERGLYEIKRALDDPLPPSRIGS